MLRRKRSKFLLCIVVIAILVMLAPTILVGPSMIAPPIEAYAAANVGWEPSTQSLRVMSFNMAHGRSNGRNQMLVSTSKITANLDAITQMLDREKPDIVALQEADKRSFWNGFFDHVGFLAEGSGFRFSTHAENIKAPAIGYGTALLSQHALQDALSVTFDKNSPIPKGFLISTIEWPAADGLLVDVVSVHLDFSSGDVREAQIKEMAAVLAERKRPAIVVGDFNFDLGTNRPKWAPLQELGLSAYEPDATGLGTHHLFNSRIDWILISSEFQFDSYEVLDDVVSDHKVVSAEISLR